MIDELKQQARQAEYDGNAKKACKYYRMLASHCERIGDIVKAHSYELKADVYDDDDKPMRFINQ